MFDYAILGLGKTGQAILKYISSHYPKAQILASDSRANDELQALPRSYPKALFELGGHTKKILQAEKVIKSPGLSPRLEIVKTCQDKRIPVISEMDFAFSDMRTKPRVVVGVTGTNGKTTTTDLLGRFFESSRMPTIVAGNIGNPLISHVDKATQATRLILELSSYQIEDSRKIVLDAALLLNVTADHLERHGSFEAYKQAKKKIFSFLDKKGLAIANFDDPCAKGLAASSASRKTYFSSKGRLESGAWVEKDQLKIQLEGEKKAWAITPSPHLLGTHNLENQMAALLTAQFFGLKEEEMAEILKNYRAPAHRLEQLGKARGILFVNDSKATNVDSVVVALLALEPLAKKRHGGIYLLLGGQDKGFPYTPLLEFQHLLKRLYIYGEAREKIKKDLKALTQQSFEGLREAAKSAFLSAQTGDIVLLSPACASFDQFKNFEERGEIFRKIFNELVAEYGP